MSAPAPARLPVLVVMPPRTLLLDVAGPIEVLRKANLVQNRVAFDVAYVGPSPHVATSVGLVAAEVRPLPSQVPDGALVILPGSANAAPADGPEDGEAEAKIVGWLRAAIVPGIQLVSICSGALLAARAGLLDDHSCTTHHACIAELTALAPLARVLENRLYVEDGERWSSAGITAGIDLMLHLVTRMAGHEAALAVARYLVVYMRRGGADPQLSPWLQGRNHLHPAVHRAQDAITADPARNWSLSDLARAAHASPRHLSRLFNEHAGMSVTEYVNGLRVARARELIAETRLDMEHVAERVGFGSTRQLRRAWNRLNALPPSVARRPRPKPDQAGLA